MCFLVPPEAPKGPIEVMEIGGDRVTIRWHSPPPREGGVPLALESYQVEMRKEADGEEWFVLATIPATKTAYTAPNLEPSVAYLFRIRAKNAVGFSEPLDSDTPIIIEEGSMLPPSAPEGPLEIKAKTMSSITIAWSPPKSDGGSQIIDYVIAIKENQRTTWLEAAQVDADKTSCAITDLVSGSEYHVRIMARNAVGKSEPLQTDRPILVERPPSLLTPPCPCQPPLKVVKVVGDAVTLQWNPPEDDGGAPITDYIISKREMQSRRWEEVDRVPGKIWVESSTTQERGGAGGTLPCLRKFWFEMGFSTPYLPQSWQKKIF